MPTSEEIEKAKTPAGGWTKEQLAAWGVAWPPPRGWKERLLADADPDDGHYWARHRDGSQFVVLRQKGQWFCCGVETPIDFDKRQIIYRIPNPTQ